MNKLTNKQNIQYFRFSREPSPEWRELTDDFGNDDETLQKIIEYINTKNERGTYIPLRHLLQDHRITHERLMYIGYTPGQIATEAELECDLDLQQLLDIQQTMTQTSEDPFENLEQLRRSLQTNYNLRHNPPTRPNPVPPVQDGNTTTFGHGKLLSKAHCKKFVNWARNKPNKRNRSDSHDTSVSSTSTNHHLHILVVLRDESTSNIENETFLSYLQDCIDKQPELNEDCLSTPAIQEKFGIHGSIIQLLPPKFTLLQATRGHLSRALQMIAAFKIRDTINNYSKYNCSAALCFTTEDLVLRYMKIDPFTTALAIKDKCNHIIYPSQNRNHSIPGSSLTDSLAMDFLKFLVYPLYHLYQVKPFPPPSNVLDTLDAAFVHRFSGSLPYVQATVQDSKYTDWKTLTNDILRKFAGIHQCNDIFKNNARDILTQVANGTLNILVTPRNVNSSLQFIIGKGIEPVYYKSGLRLPSLSAFLQSLPSLNDCIFTPNIAPKPDKHEQYHFVIQKIDQLTKCHITNTNQERRIWHLERVGQDFTNVFHGKIKKDANYIKELLNTFQQTIAWKGRQRIRMAASFSFFNYSKFRFLSAITVTHLDNLSLTGSEQNIKWRDKQQQDTVRGSLESFFVLDRIPKELGMHLTEKQARQQTLL